MIKHYKLEGKLDAQDFLSKRTELLDQMFPQSDLMPGALRLLLHLHKHQIPMAIATSSNKRHYEMKTTKHKSLFGQVFDFVITGDEVSQSKPHPEIFQTAAQHFQHLTQDPKEILVFEDAVLGVQAAKSAGMNVIWVYDSQAVQDHPGLDANESMKSLFYFKPETYGLPGFNQN